jgi:hypothetical protein
VIRSCKSCPWTEDNDRRLLEMVKQGKHRAFIAATLGRAEVSIGNRLLMLRGKENRAGQGHRWVNN